MIKQDDKTQYLTSTAIKTFFTSFLSEVFVFILATVAYFGIFYSVQNAQLKEARQLRTDSYNTVLRVGKDSGLYHSNKHNTTSFDITNYYQYFVASFLYYDYKSDVYDYEKDPDGFKKQEQHFKDDITLLTVHDGYVDDTYIGNFYTHFAIGRVSTNGEPLVSYSQPEAISYYVKDILKADDSTSGGKFFDYVTDTTVPHLKSEVRTLLFGYVINSVITAKTTEMDKQFYAYFLPIFEAASNLLMKDKEYVIAYNNYESSNDKIISLETISVVSSVAISIVIIFAIVPLFDKKRRNPAQYITRIVMIGKNDKIGFWQYFGQFISAIIKYFHITILIALFTEFRSLTQPLFYIGSFGVTTLLFACISLVICLVSIIISVLQSEHKNLDCFIARGNLCVISRSFGNNKLSDTVSE